MGSMGAYIRSYDVAVLQREKLSGTHILLNVLIVGRHTLAIDSALDAGQCVVVNNVPSIVSTSGEHLAAASANFSIGLVLPGIVMGGVDRVEGYVGEEASCWTREYESRQEHGMLGSDPIGPSSNLATSDDNHNKARNFVAVASQEPFPRLTHPRIAPHQQLLPTHLIARGTA